MRVNDSISDRSRKAVMFRGQRVPGLYARTGKRGTTYQAMLRHDGRLLSPRPQLL